ncbi:MAG: FAD-dependent oxidoreductase [Streptococcaceae bacterium]|jgi:NADPH-dependent 2,4-dienoyl-CoA reductase/sulfur reductase-like enzyme|nr:FAD-dependent oxidoreductase [Streptococcaceae bacterium]
MKIIIIGGSHAGISCALRAREEYPESEIIIFETQKEVGFISQSIPLYLSGATDFLKMSSYTTALELEKRGIDVHTQMSVTAVSLAKKEITYVDLLSQDEHLVGFDKLILATGSYPVLPMVKGDFQDKLFVIKKFEDAIKIKKFMNESRSVIIIGGGAIGVELAELMNQARFRTTLLHSSDYILNRYLDEYVAIDTQKSLEERGVALYTHSIVTDIFEEEIQTGKKTKKISRVVTQDGREFTAEGIIYATGFRPNTALVANQVLRGDKGAILVDEYMQTSHPDVFAVGDCSTTIMTHVATPRYVPHASDAIRQGEVAAVNLLAPKVKLNKSQGTYKLNFDQDIALCMTGLSFRKAKQEGFDCEVVYVEDRYANSDQYYQLWLVYEKGTHKILGLQSKGTAPEIPAHADIISLAIQNDMTIEEVEFTDFYYKHGFKNPKSFTNIIADKIRRQEKSVTCSNPLDNNQPLNNAPDSSKTQK